MTGCKHEHVILVGGQLPYCPDCEQFVIAPVRVLLRRADSGVAIPGLAAELENQNGTAAWGVDTAKADVAGPTP